MKPTLQPNTARDAALAELPEDADIRIVIATTRQDLRVQMLKPGAAAKGRVDWDDTFPGQTRLLQTGAALQVLCPLQKAEILICREITDSSPIELLIQSINTRPLSDFTRPQFA